MFPSPGRVRVRAGRSGMTLIELLLAVAIAVLVLGVVLSAYHMVSVTLAGQQARRRGPDAAARAVEQLSRDLQCVSVVPAGDLGAFTASPDSGPAKKDTDLAFCTAVVPPGEGDLRWSHLERVRYHAVDVPGAGLTLLREHRPLAGPDAFLPPQTNVVAEGLAGFRVTVYDGAAWQGRWPPDRGPTCPAAARIEVALGTESGERMFRTEVLIPAGQVVTSSLVRAGQAAP